MEYFDFINFSEKDLKNKYNKPSLQEVADELDIKYQKNDTKAMLINDIKNKLQNVTKGKLQNVSENNIEVKRTKTILYSFKDIVKDFIFLSPLERKFINKKYKGQKHSEQGWSNILKQERLF